MKSIKLMLLFFIGMGLSSCSDQKVKRQEAILYEAVKSIKLNIKAANNLIELPLACVFQEYPNKLGQVVGGKGDLREPRDLHPSFYGCFDWHSSVHGHWSLVKLLKDFPNIENKEDAISKLKQNISKENILKELEYFEGHNKTYERTYGWAWLLKLAEELHTWEDPLARDLESNLQPMTDMIVGKYAEFLPKLVYPIRVGEHPNTAFGMSFALDYAKAVGNVGFESLLKKRAKDYYQSDKNCPITWEPSGFDFLSPCLEEASLMSRVLPKDEYIQWLDLFLPQLKDRNFELAVGKVSDRTDGKLVHLDGVNFSRAWCLKSIAETDHKYNHLITVVNKHIENSLPALVGDSYEGGHWLGSFAIYACQ
ncbi:MAG: hypothetical protein ACJATI_001592 [Halioglobus sp.]|jgi:hypothetical protein